MFFFKTRIKIESDLLPLISEKAKKEGKSIELVVDMLLRRQLVEGPIYRCAICHHVALPLRSEDKGCCGRCGNFVPIYKN
jgi:hypothetical protein